MTKKNLAYIHKLTWKDVRHEVAKVKPELAKCIDDLDPGKEFIVYKAGYPFGSYILKDGLLNIPLPNGELVAVTDPRIEREIIQNLAYTSAYSSNMPVGVILSHTMELYWMTGRQPASTNFRLTGNIFSLWGSLQAPGTSAYTGRMWNITAGTRSLIMLPKISFTEGYKKLKKEFGLHTPIPTNLSEQWPLLSELANSPLFGEPWFTELLFFSEAWLKKIKSDDSAWRMLKLYLLETVWADTTFLRNQMVFNYVFSRALIDKNLRPDPYLADIVKHLYSISSQGVPGFKIASDDSAAPVPLLQKIFSTIYPLQFAPTLLHPSFLNSNEPLSPVYYSLGVSTLMHFSPKSRKAPNKLNDLREIRHIERNVSAYIREDSLGMRATAIYKMVSEVDYDYFHSDQDTFDEIRSSTELAGLDSALIAEAEKYPHKPFCHTSPFLRGCVRIAAKKKP